MTLRDAIRSVFRRYFDDSGRARRAEFWWWALTLAVVSTLNRAIFGATPLGWLIGTVIFLGALIPTIAVVIRRLHDAGIRAGWALLGVVPVVGWGVLLYLLARPGQPCSNRYGASPRGTISLVKTAT